MDENRLTWNEENRRKVFDCRVFSVWESFCKSPKAQSLEKTAVFSIIDARDWVIVIPVIEGAAGKQFVMVWQWRHGSRCLSLEFPGGVLENGETPEEAAFRELREETGYTSGKIEKIGEFSPNPAIMSNKVHFFMASDLGNRETQKLDDDEYVEVTLIDTEEVVRGMGNPPYVHALMGTALALYNKKSS